MQCCEESHKGSGFRRAQIFPVCRHVAAALDHLPNEFILRQADCNSIERWSTFASKAVQRMTVAALLCLKNKSAASFEGRASLQILNRNRIATPCVHDRAPRRMYSQFRKSAERDRNQ